VIGLWWWSGRRDGQADKALASLATAFSSPEALQVAAGIMFGLAVTARLTILFGLPFFLFVGGGGNWLRRGMLAGAGAAVPLVTLLVITYATSGHLFNPAYDYLYHIELAYPLNYNAGWSITDIRYIPQNLGIMFRVGCRAFMPELRPSVYPATTAMRRRWSTSSAGLFNPSCPLAIPAGDRHEHPAPSPAFLLAPLAWRPLRHLQASIAPPPAPPLRSC
jgi:hypothetical protein